jgi:hypothetical protein
MTIVIFYYQSKYQVIRAITIIVFLWFWYYFKILHLFSGNNLYYMRNENC